MFPTYLQPLSALDCVEVVAEVRPKNDENGVQKRCPFAPGVGWIVPIEIVHGEREKTLPTGRTMTVLDSDVVNITVWSMVKPNVHVGDYVRFPQMAVGAVQNTLFWQSMDIEKVETKTDGLEEMFGGENDE